MRESADHSLAAEAYGIVRQRILRGELALGDAVSRRKLAKELGMSFLPISEALLRLEFEGLLESRPRAGTRVRIPSAEDVRGQYVLREALEVKAAMLCAEMAQPRDIAELRKLAVRVDTLSTQVDRMPYLTLHQKFHRRIAECSQCAVLSDAIEQTHALASPWFCAMQRQPGGERTRRHEELIDAIASRDPNVAADIMRQHVAVGMRHALQILKPYFDMSKASNGMFRRGRREAKPTVAVTVN